MVVKLAALVADCSSNTGTWLVLQEYAH